MYRHFTEDLQVTNKILTITDTRVTLTTDIKVNQDKIKQIKMKWTSLTTCLKIFLLFLDLTSACNPYLGVCPYTWTKVGNRCYKVSPDTMIWHQAQQVNLLLKNKLFLRSIVCSSVL